MKKLFLLFFLVTTISLLGFLDISDQRAFANNDRVIDDVYVVSEDETIEKHDDWLITDNGVVYIHPDATLTVKGEFVIEQGTLNILNGGELITDNGNVINVIRGTIVNDGIIRVNSSVPSIGLDNDGIINNYGTLYLWGDGSSFTNDGTIINNNSGFIYTDIMSLFNYGKIENQGGRLQNDSLISNDFDGIINNDDNGTIDNRGKIDNSAIINNFSGFINNYQGGTLENDDTIINYANINIQNSGTVTNILYTNSITNALVAGEIHNRPDGKINIADGGTLENQYGVNVHNYGIVNFLCNAQIIGDGNIVDSGNGKVIDWCEGKVIKS